MSDKEILVLDASAFGVDGSRAAQIEAVFVPMVKMLKEFETVYNSVVEESEKGITPEVVALAKSTRVAISKVRIKTESARKEQKEEYLRGGKAIDGVANILKFAISEKEEHLKSIETHYENIEKKRMEKIHTDRTEELAGYGVDDGPSNLGDMPIEVWERYRDGCHFEHEKIIEAEKKAEEAAAAAEEAEKARQKELAEENEKLKVEAERMAERKAEAEKFLKAERDRRIGLELEKQSREREERRIIAEEEAKKQAALLAPDRDKLLVLADLLSEIEIPVVETPGAMDILEQVVERLAKTHDDLVSRANQL